MAERYKEEERDGWVAKENMFFQLRSHSAFWQSSLVKYLKS